MNSINILKKFIVLVGIIFASFLFADQGIVSFNDTQTYSSDVTSKAIVVDNNGTMYIANGNNGILVLDNNMSRISSTIIGGGKTITHITLDNSYVYATSDDGYIFVLQNDDGNLSDEHNISIDGKINDIKVQSNYIYVANGTNGVKVINASDKSNMTIDASLSTSNAHKILIVGDTLLLADDWGGLKSINISTPDDPSVANQYDGTFMNIAIDNNKLFALNTDDNILYAFDITNPLLPIFKSQKTINSGATAMYGYDSNVYIVIDGRIYAYQSIDMTNLTDNGSYNNASSVNDLIVVDSIGYISNTDSIQTAIFQSDLPNTFAVASANDAISIDYNNPKNIVGVFPADRNDTDIIKINTQVGVVTLDINVSAGIRCILLDENNNTINEINNSDTNQSILNFSNNIFAKDYYIKLQPLESNTESIDYSITISLFKDKEPNTMDVSSLIDIGENVEGDILTPSDKDVFKVFISSAGKFTFKSDSLQLITKLYDNKLDKTVSSSGTLETGGIIFNITHSGYYFIELGSNQSSYNYSFTTILDKNGFDEYDDKYKPSLKLLYAVNNSSKSLAFDGSNIYFGTTDAITKNNLDTTVSQLSSKDTNIAVNDMQIAGNYLFAALNNGDIVKYKINNDNTLQLIGSCNLNNSISKIIIDGNYAYTYVGSTIYKVNISGSTLVLEDSFDISDTINDIALKNSIWNKDGAVEKTKNTYIYIATTNGLKVYSADENKLLNIYNTDTTSIDKLLIDNNRLYMVKNNRVNIYDISVPVYASLLGVCYIGGGVASDIAIDSNHLYIEPNLRVVDISDETKPKFVISNYNSSETKIKIRDNIAYVIDSSSILKLYEVKYDYSDDNSSAKDISLNGTTKGNISSIIHKYQSEQFDVDWFKVNITTSGILDINFTSDINLSYSSDSLTNKTNLSPGVYYLKVQGDDINNTGDYNISTLFTSDDHSDIALDATSLALNTTNTNNSLFITGKDTDWFKIVLNDRGQIDISTTVNNADTTTKIELYYDDMQTQITKEGFNTDANNTNYSYKVETTLNPGTYYIKITGADDTNLSKNIGDYNLTTVYKKTDDFILQNGYDGINDYNVEYIAYGNQNIFTITNEAKIVSYNQLLKKLGSKELGFPLDQINNLYKIFIVNEYMYINTIDGYTRIPIDMEKTDNVSVSSRSFEYFVDLYLRELGYTDAGSIINSMALKDNNLFVATKDNILTYDVTDKSNPKLKALYGKHSIQDLDSDALYTYVVGDKGIFIYDNNGTMQSSYIFENSSDIQDVLVDGTKTFVLTSYSLRVFDTSDKLNIKLLKTIYDNDVVYNMQDMHKTNNYLYISAENGFKVFDMSSLSFIKDYHSEFSGFNTSYIDGNELYLSGYHGIEIIDISDINNFKSEFYYPLVDANGAITVDANKIYLSQDGYIYNIDKNILLKNLTSKNESDLSFINNLDYITVDENNSYEAQISYDEAELGDFNNSSDGAYEINKNAFIEGNITSDDTDWLTFTVPYLTKASFNINKANNLKIRLYKDTSYITSLGYYSDIQYSVDKDLTPGTYYLKVYGYDDSTEGDYNISIITKPVAVAEQLPTELKGSSKYNDADYYVLNIENNTSIYFETDNTNIEVYDAINNSYNFSISGNSNQYMSKGVYFLKVYSDREEPYSIKISTTENKMDSFSKPLNKGEKVNGTFSGDNLEDWYKVETNSSVDVILKSDDKASFTIYDENWSCIDSTNDDNSNYYIDGVKLQNSGIYYIRINCWRSTKYTLSVNDVALSNTNALVSGSIKKFVIDGSDLKVYSNNNYYNNSYDNYLIKTYDISNDMNNTNTSAVTLGDVELNISKIKVDGSNLYVENTANQVDEYNISNPYAISKVAQDVNISVDDGFMISKTIGVNKYSIENSSFKRYDVKDSLNPKEMESIGLGDNGKFLLDTTNSYAYIKTDNSYSFQIINLDSLHYEARYNKFNNIHILNADDKYLYEYAQEETASENNKYILRNARNEYDINVIQNAGIYQIDSANIIIPKGDIVLVASDENLSVIDFSSNKVGVVKSTLTFDSNITLMKVNPSLNVVYIKVESQDALKIYNFDDPTNLKEITAPLFNSDIMPDINSMHIVKDKLFIASKDFGIQSATILDNGSLSLSKNIENIGINIRNVFSMDGSVVNYTSTKTRGTIGQGKDDLNVFFLRKEAITDGNSDNIYSINEQPSEGCFIATAAYGSYFEQHVKVLRDFRDHYLLTNYLGRKFVHLYYTYSPSIAREIANNEFEKNIVRITLTPIVYLIKYPLYGFLLMLGLFFFVYVRKYKIVNK